jgi:hypothetical protein
VIDLQHQEKEIEACSEAVEIPPGFECIAVAATASISSGPSSNLPDQKFVRTPWGIKFLQLGLEGKQGMLTGLLKGLRTRHAQTTWVRTSASPAGHAQLPFLAKQQTAEEAEVLLLSSKESEKLKSA